MKELLKYKLWNMVTKRFVEKDTDYENRKGCNIGQFSLKPDGTICFYESTEGGMEVFRVENLIVVRSSGLLDINKIEIKEGDIVKWKWNTEEVYVVKFGMHCIQCMEFDDIYGFYIDKIGSDDGYGGKTDQENLGEVYTDIEVVGNIYENPELLESEVKK